MEGLTSFRFSTNAMGCGPKSPFICAGPANRISAMNTTPRKFCWC